MSNWVEWFNKDLGKYPSPWAYLFDNAQYMLPVVRAIRRHCSPPASLLEVGCGVGIASMIFSAHGYEVVGIDNDPSVLTMAHEMPWIATRGGSLVFKMGSAYHLPSPFNIATSLGLIEHEDWYDQVHMLRQLRLVSNYHVVVIPSPLQLRLTHPTMGERSISLRRLVNLCKEAEWEVVEAFGFGRVRSFIPATRYTSLSFCVIGVSNHRGYNG